MTTISRLIASAAIVGLTGLSFPAGARAQAADSPFEAGPRVASFPPGSIQGVVQDERTNPVPGALVTAVGATTIMVVADKDGRFAFRSLPPGPYFVRAHLAGYVTPPAQVVRVRSTSRSDSTVTLRHTGASPVLAAGFGFGAATDPPADAQPQPSAGTDSEGNTAKDGTSAQADDPSETAWRVRHSRRTILKDVNLGDLGLAGNGSPRGTWTPVDFLGHAAQSSAHLATSFLADTPFSGQVNLLTSDVFEQPQQLFASDQSSHGNANVMVSAPVGDDGDWTVRGALTQSDISSWIVAASYLSRVPAVHRYDMGVSYAMQRDTGANPLALASVSDGSRNVGELFAFDTYTISPLLSVTYGARYRHFDYLDHQGIASPRVEVAISPAEHLRVSAEASLGGRAPGEEEFAGPTDSGIWLPPQRTFSSLDPSRPLRAETTRVAAIEMQRDIAGSTVGFRVFHQHVNDQLATIFDAEVPNGPEADLGHYLVATAGNAVANGCAASFSTAVATWLRGSVEYSVANANLTPAGNVDYLVLAAPSALRPRSEYIHNVSTTLETRMPVTATRVLVLYRISNGFARPGPNSPAFDERFDVQVRQSLPFMNFSNARWEMLLAVRNFFREGDDDQSIYDELLVVRPPKRIVGGLTMRF